MGEQITEEQITEEQIESTCQRLNKDALAGGYNLNPDTEFTRELVWGLITNERRYGYMACPCRISSGNKQDDLDIICPCDYRDQDLEEYDACYCALYVSPEIMEGKKEPEPIPERRPTVEEREGLEKGKGPQGNQKNLISDSRRSSNNNNSRNNDSKSSNNRDINSSNNIDNRNNKREGMSTSTGNLPYPVWRCKVCGYLCARESPPGICPVCKATKDRFERFL